jgi:hypothetical protein
MYIYVEVYFLKRIKLLWITGETNLEILEILKFCENFEILNFKIFILFILNFLFFFFNFEILWNFMKTEILKKKLKFWNHEIFEILTKKNGFLDSDDNARGSRITIAVVSYV